MRALSRFPFSLLTSWSVFSPTDGDAQALAWTGAVHVGRCSARTADILAMPSGIPPQSEGVAPNLQELADAQVPADKSGPAHLGQGSVLDRG